MYELGKVFTSKFVGTEPSSYKKRIYRAAVSQRLETVLYHPRATPQASFKPTMPAFERPLSKALCNISQ